MRRSARIHRRSITDTDLSSDTDGSVVECLSAATKKRKTRKTLETPSKINLESINETVKEFDEYSQNTSSSVEKLDNVGANETRKYTSMKSVVLTEAMYDAVAVEMKKTGRTATSAKKRQERPKQSIHSEKLESIEEATKLTEAKIIYADDQNRLKSDHFELNSSQHFKEQVVKSNEDCQAGNSEILITGARSNVDKSFFQFDVSKYNLSEGIKDKKNPLLKVSQALQKHMPFKEHLKKYLSSSGDETLSNVDCVGLESIQLPIGIVETSNKLPSVMQSRIDTSNLYFKATSTEVSKTSANHREIQNLLKKSVLQDDLEKREDVPKLFESEYKKKKLRKAKREETAGKNWYNLPKPEMTEELKRDLQLIKMRNVLDNKHHYKRNDSNQLPKYFEVGTIVEGAHEFYSNRIPKKQRKRTIVEELLEDADLRRRNKKKLIEIKKKQMSGGKGFYKQKKNKGKPAWART